MSVGQIAVVRHSKPAELEIGIQRLDVADDGVAGRGVAVVADGSRSGQRGNHPGIAEIVADQAHALVGVEARAVEADDAGRLLPAMLQRMHAEGGDRGGVGHIPNPEHAAFFMQLVVLRSGGGKTHNKALLLPARRLAGRATHGGGP